MPSSAHLYPAFSETKGCRACWVMAARGTDTTIDELERSAPAPPEAWADTPWGDRSVKVAKKIFVFLGCRRRARPPMPSSRLARLRVELRGPVLPGYGLGKHGWVTIPTTCFPSRSARRRSTSSRRANQQSPPRRWSAARCATLRSAGRPAKPPGLAQPDRVTVRAVELELPPPYVCRPYAGPGDHQAMADTPQRLLAQVGNPETTTLARSTTLRQPRQLRPTRDIAVLEDAGGRPSAVRTCWRTARTAAGTADVAPTHGGTSVRSWASQDAGRRGAQHEPWAVGAPAS